MTRTGLLATLLLTIVGTSSPAQVPPSAPAAGDLRCPLDAAYDRNNPFAKILRHELPFSTVAEDDKVIAIVPLEWTHPGHVLIIPKREVRNLLDLRDDEVVAVLHMAKRVAVAQQKALGSTGFSLQQNNAWHQDVCHAHFHVIPDTPPTPTPHATRAQMDEMAARLREALPAG